MYVCVYVFVPVNVCFQKSKYILGSMFVEKPVRGQGWWVLLTPGEPTQHRSTIFTLQIVSHFLLWFLPLPLAFAYFFTFFTQPLLLCICVFLAELSLYEQFKFVSTNIGLPCVFSIFQQKFVFYILYLIFCLFVFFPNTFEGRVGQNWFMGGKFKWIWSSVQWGLNLNLVGGPRQLHSSLFTHIAYFHCEFIMTLS